MEQTVADYESIAYEVADGYATVTLNRPEKRNALSRPLLAEFEAALWDADDDKSVHCVVVKGAGPDFCSGYDLAGMQDFSSQPDRPRRGKIGRAHV